MYIGPLLYEQLGMEVKVTNVSVYGIFIEKSMHMSWALINKYITICDYNPN
jgi:hypothetical protein